MAQHQQLGERERGLAAFVGFERELPADFLLDGAQVLPAVDLRPEEAALRVEIDAHIPVQTQFLGQRKRRAQAQPDLQTTAAVFPGFRAFVADRDRRERIAVLL